jgi:hypothetical protein
MDRVQFFESISGIDYPLMLVNFFDHFLALKQLVENSGKIKVPQQQDENNHIIFNIEFSNTKAKETAIDLIKNNNVVMIYERPIYINIIGLPVDDLKNLTIELY